VHEPTILSFPPPTCNAHPGAVVVHAYWTAYDSPPDLPFVCYTPYNVGNNNIVKKIAHSRSLSTAQRASRVAQVGVASFINQMT